MDCLNGFSGQPLLYKFRILISHISIFFNQNEAQGQYVAHFPERIFIYHSRIFDRYKMPVVTLAILTDDNPSWHPNEYQFTALGFEHRMIYPIAKLLHYKDKQAILEQSDNPFALVVLAHLAAMDAGKNDTAGLDAKIMLTRHLYRLAKKRGKNKEFVRHLLNAIDFLLALPYPRALEYRQELHIIEQEMHMSYVSSIELLAQQEGMARGMREGMQQGMQKGLEQTQREIATNLLKMGIEKDRIAAATGLSVKNLDDIDVSH